MWCAVWVHTRGAGKNGIAVAGIATLAAWAIATSAGDANGNPITLSNVMAVVATAHSGNRPYPFMAADGWIVGFTGQESVKIGAANAAVGDINVRFALAGLWGGELFKGYRIFAGNQCYLDRVSCHVEA